MSKCGWIVWGGLLGVLGAREEVCARSFRSWFGFGKTDTAQNPTPEKVETDSAEQTESQPQTPPEQKTNPAHSSSSSHPASISTPAFMVPPKELNDPWQSYSEGPTSLALQGLVYIRDDQWTVWLNGSILLPTLRSLAVGDQTVRVTTVTPRSVTLQCPNEAITLTVGQIYDLRTHQLSRR